MTQHLFAGLAIAGLAATAACGDDDSAGPATAPAAAVIDLADGSTYHPTMDPADFVATIDNPYLPLRPGARWVYEGETEDGLERIEVTVLDERRLVIGIEAVVVRDTVTVDGEVVEDTWDWFAQDRDGNVWYLGEDTAEYENGEIVSHAGAWEAGVDGAVPGIVMLAEPAVGDAYRQEYYPGEAEDLAEVARIGVAEEVAYGSFDDLLVTTEWNPLEPDVVEEKYYAEGIGVVLEVMVRGGDERIELVEFTPGS